MEKTKKAGITLNEGANLLAAGKIDEAIKAFKKALKLDNKIVAAHFNLGLAYIQKEDTKNAISHFKETIVLKPNDFEAYNNLGNLYMGQNKLDQALYCFQKATAINPYLAEGFYNLGVAYMSKGQYLEAIKSYKISLKIYPQNSIVLNNIGVTLEKIGKADQSVAYYKKALKINPENSMSLVNVGANLIFINPKQAATFFKRAIEVDPSIETAYYNLGVCLRILGDTTGSIENFEKALELNPDFSPTYGQLYHQVRDICDWKRAIKMETPMRNFTTADLKKNQVPAETPFVSVVYDSNPQKNYQIARAWSKYIKNQVAHYDKPYNFKRSKKAAKIRIGYLSNDFRNHATSHLIMGFFRLHNRKKFDIFAYSYGENDKSKYRLEIEKVTRFRDIINLSHSKAADLIYHDNIDILIDLKGHTQNSRMEIPALRPAPIQVNYLGFPGTSGADFFDYFITDKIVTPKSHTPFYSEKLIFLPNCYQVNDRDQVQPKKGVSKKDLFLPENAFLFCSFNQPYKIDPKMFDIWMRILKAVQQSYLCLLDKNPKEVSNILDEAKKRGVDPKRIHFGWSLTKEMHLTRLSLCDLALDTFPCNGHTTTSDALWAGLPVVTLQGNHFASRVSSSLLSAVGLPELITHSPKEYEKLAISLASDPKKLQAIRKLLILNRKYYPLFDTKKFVSNLEKAYTKMWENYTRGKKPEMIIIKSS